MLPPQSHESEKQIHNRDFYSWILGASKKDTTQKTNMTGRKIHHEWVDVFPIENGDFPMSC